MKDFDAFRLACDGFTPARETMECAETLVRDFATKLLAPDALHLASAMQAGAVLVTFDERLANAARDYQTNVIMPA